MTNEDFVVRGVIAGIMIFFLVAAPVALFRGEAFGQCISKECVARKLQEGWDMKYCDRTLSVKEYTKWNITCSGKSFTYCDVGVVPINKNAKNDKEQLFIKTKIVTVNTSAVMEEFHNRCETEIISSNRFTKTEVQE